ncbi:MAG: SCP2 sterol-binding domain-containing protein [Alphaproteobacteria bacterium]
MSSFAPAPEGAPCLPPLAGRLLAPLPLGPIALVAGRLLGRIARHHPEMFDRLGESATKTFLIDATDLPFVFVLRPDPLRPRIAVTRRGRIPAFDARIAGPLAALLGLVQGTYDGDALFFSRDLMIEGDVEAVLALRNAIDDAELDLLSEATGLLGPLRRPAEALSRDVLPVIHWLARALPPQPLGRRAP